MSKRLLILIAALAGLVLAAGAVPALTADSGTVSVTITAQAPPAPCLSVTPGTVNFGTLPFSPNAQTGVSENTDITVTNCGTADQNLLGSTTDAIGPGGSWTPLADNGFINPCTALDRFYLYIFTFQAETLYMTGTPAPVLALGGGAAAVFPAGAVTGSRLGLIMPCQGSNGAGETKTLTATFTAVVA